MFDKISSLRIPLPADTRKMVKAGKYVGGSDMISFWEKHKPFTCKQATHGQRLKSTKVVLKSITCACSNKRTLIKQKRKGIMDQLHAEAFKCSVTRPAFKLSGWEFLMASIEMFIVIVKTSFKKIILRRRSTLQQCFFHSTFLIL